MEKAQRNIEVFQLENVVIELQDLMCLDNETFQNFDLIYTSAACGGLFDCKLFYLALKYNLGMLCKKIKTENIKHFCRLKATRIAQAEVHKTGEKTDADLSTGENLQRRDIYFIDIHKLHEDEDDSTLLEGWQIFYDWIRAEDKCNRSSNKNINQTWFTRIFDTLKVCINTNKSTEAISTVDMNLTYWGSFAKNASSTVSIVEPIKCFQELVANTPRMTDRIWRQAKENFCLAIIDLFQQNTQSIEELFPDIDEYILLLTIPQQIKTSGEDVQISSTAGNNVLIMETCQSSLYSNKENYINTMFVEWMTMIKMCTDLQPNITILVDNQRDKCLWQELLEERMEIGFLEIYSNLSELNETVKFDIIIDSINPSNIGANKDAYFKALVQENGYIFLAKNENSSNCLVSEMRIKQEYKNYVLMTTIINSENEILSGIMKNNESIDSLDVEDISMSDE